MGIKFRMYGVSVETVLASVECTIWVTVVKEIVHFQTKEKEETCAALERNKYRVLGNAEG